VICISPTTYFETGTGMSISSFNFFYFPLPLAPFPFLISFESPRSFI